VRESKLTAEDAEEGGGFLCAPQCPLRLNNGGVSK
jgi:hypothetical protein